MPGKTRTRLDCAVLTQISPGLEAVAVLRPFDSDVGAVEHVLKHDVVYPAVGLFAGVFNGGSGAGNNQGITGFTGNSPIALNYFYIAEVNAVQDRFFIKD